eukprot:scaffold5.g933.t1
MECLASSRAVKLAGPVRVQRRCQTPARQQQQLDGSHARRAGRRCAVQSSSDIGTVAAAPSGASVPPLLNAIPHDRAIRRHFYNEVANAVTAAVAAGELRLEVRLTIPELNTEFDVYRAGTMLELVREVATALGSPGGRRVRVCVQQPLGKGVFAGLPLSLNGVARMMKQMDWGAAAEYTSQGQLGGSEVDEADAFVVIAPQNIVGHSVIHLLEEMAAAAEAQTPLLQQGKPLILINPKLGDIQSSGGVMGVRGRLLYLGASMYPIMGALRYSYGGPWEVFKRVELGLRLEEYRWIAGFPNQPSPKQITEAFQRSRQEGA